MKKGRFFAIALSIRLVRRNNSFVEYAELSRYQYQTGLFFFFFLFQKYTPLIIYLYVP